MKLQVFDNYDQVSRRAAEIVIEESRKHPQLVLGLATGSTPIGLYREMVQVYQRGQLDFSEATTFNLDEYYPITPDHPQSFRRFMQEHLFDHVNIAPERIHFLSGTAADVESECSRYEAAIEAAGGIDIQVLGIGENGHIGFNEPGTPFHLKTHKVALTENTIQANSRFFERIEDVPRHALTMGISSIMRSRKILLLASGEKKAEAIKAALQGPVTEELPASVLQLHPDVTVMVDKTAATQLEGVPYKA
ncbi:glucosamine-6-phosphate deaminase [Brevibacillus humidisoli]|uniref:glucosamine-6-phosphate deaminase n=1 Tax=Brevibacillus humidisoli TaxID=2895522 RepID=UPI001E33E159|nr:glucosamine-6-phosphate deaminase [Brevibacillus humidisoli]UFJ41444.1 glucosamine-6-phosphate deaminase [Brevibacillus humidisoli]